MAKITKGRDFGGAVRYVTQDKKEAKIQSVEDNLIRFRNPEIATNLLESLNKHPSISK